MVWHINLGIRYGIKRGSLIQNLEPDTKLNINKLPFSQSLVSSTLLATCKLILLLVENWSLYISSSLPDSHGTPLQTLTPYIGQTIDEITLLLCKNVFGYITREKRSPWIENCRALVRQCLIFNKHCISSMLGSIYLTAI